MNKKSVSRKWLFRMIGIVVISITGTRNELGIGRFYATYHFISSHSRTWHRTRSVSYAIAGYLQTGVSQVVHGC